MHVMKLMAYRREREREKVFCFCFEEWKEDLQGGSTNVVGELLVAIGERLEGGRVRVVASMSVGAPATE